MGFLRTTTTWLQGFANRIFGARQLIAANNSIQPVIVGGPATYPDPNALRFVQEGYSANATVFTIISNVSRKFGSIPRYAYKVSDKKSLRAYRQFLKQGKFTLAQITKLEKKAFDETVMDDIPFANLLARPNEDQGQDFFFAYCCTFYMLIGESFIWLNRGNIEDKTDAQADAMEPLEMFIIPPQYVELIPDPSDVWGVVGYYFVVNGQRVFLRKNDVIHWRTPNPNFDAITRVHQRGFSALNAGNKLVTQDDSATDAAVAMHQNDGAKGALFNKSFDNLDPVQKSQLENVINRKINNRDIKGAIATLQGDWGFIDMSMSSVDMQLTQGQEAVFVRLCNLWGINPMMFLANATFENVEQARKDLITHLILPMACSLRDEMNRVLLPAFGLSPKDTTHDVDVTQLPELQNEMAALVTALQQAWWMTPNQKLAAMNEEESDDPNMDKRWIPNSLVLMDDAGMTDLQNSFTDGPGPNQTLGDPKGADPLNNDSGEGNPGGLSGKTKGKGAQA